MSDETKEINVSEEVQKLKAELETLVQDIQKIIPTAASKGIRTPLGWLKDLPKKVPLKNPLTAIKNSDLLDPDTWKGIKYILDARREAAKRRKDGDYPVDEYGLDEEFFDKCRPMLSFLYHKYWRVETFGIENIPSEGPALLVCNHSGVLPWDGAMVNAAVWEEHPNPRYVRTLFLQWFTSVPIVAPLLARTGQVLACPENAQRLLEEGRLVAVFPEGLKGVGKLYKDRYHLARFGRGGFIRTAIHGKAPIIPVSIVGAEEIHPNLLRLDFLGKPLGLPYFPITPTFPLLGPLGVIPLPSKWMIKFCEPIPMDSYTAQDALDFLTVSKLTETVRENIQDGIKELLVKRKRAFF